MYEDKYGYEYKYNCFACGRDSNPAHTKEWPGEGESYFCDSCYEKYDPYGLLADEE